MINKSNLRGIIGQHNVVNVILIVEVHQVGWVQTTAKDKNVRTPDNCILLKKLNYWAETTEKSMKKKYFKALVLLFAYETYDLFLQQSYISGNFEWVHIWLCVKYLISRTGSNKDTINLP